MHGAQKELLYSLLLVIATLGTFLCLHNLINHKVTCALLQSSTPYTVGQLATAGGRGAPARPAGMRSINAVSFGDLAQAMSKLPTPLRRYDAEVDFIRDDELPDG